MGLCGVVAVNECSLHAEAQWAGNGWPGNRPDMCILAGGSPTLLLPLYIGQPSLLDDRQAYVGPITLWHPLAFRLKRNCMTCHPDHSSPSVYLWYDIPGKPGPGSLFFANYSTSHIIFTCIQESKCLSYTAEHPRQPPRAFYWLFFPIHSIHSISIVCIKVRCPLKGHRG